MKPKQIKVHNAIKDFTEQDAVRQNYYRLQAEQAAWNLMKPVKRKLFSWI